MGCGSLGIVAIWLAGVAAICRADPLGRPFMGAALALAGAALVGVLGY